MYRISSFCLSIPVNDGFILKSTLTGAVIKLTNEMYSEMNVWLKNQTKASCPKWIDLLIEPNRILVEAEKDEFSSLRSQIFDIRNNKAHLFTLYFEPTLNCQFECGYCIEKGANKGTAMTLVTLEKAVTWLEEYIKINPEIDSLRLVFFGGEPLLCKENIRLALNLYSQLAKKLGIKYWSEIITNGELLDESIASDFSKHNWRRVQVTLDGPKRIHDARRHGKNDRPTFDNVMKNISMLINTDYIPKVDLRLSLDQGSAPAMLELVGFLASFGKQDRIRLSLGLTTPTLYAQIKRLEEQMLATAALKVWEHAHKMGFEIPDEFVDGPLCVALAKHSAVLQPNGKLQKCFCMSGREQYDFASVEYTPVEYTKDERFERVDTRRSVCVSEKCTYLPMCGGGCVHNSVVAYGEDGFSQRHCQKQLLTTINEGLLRLNYGK
jgi:uncharacterized protein